MRGRPPTPPVRAGLVGLLVIAVATWFAFGGGLPFGDPFEVRAVFTSASNVKEGAPVRVAGVNVGEVTAVEHPEPGKELAVVTLRIDDEGADLREDAQVKIRPRLFLEGNWFVDVRPGTPGARKLEDGEVIPVRQTRTPVQLSQLFTALQADTRKNLKSFLREYSAALEEGGAEGYRRSIRFWEPAYRNTALVQTATLGLREHDLSEYVRGAGRVARGLDRDPDALKGLITDFNTAAGAFARESANLEQAIAELPRTLRAGRPALAALNRSLPSLRGLAVDLRPGVRESDRTLDVALPFLRQARALVSRRELRGLVSQLRPTVPPLTRLAARSVPLYEQLRLASSCENEVLDPWSRDKLEDPNFPASGPIYEEAPKGLPGLAGESRTFDANGQWFRSLTTAGDRTVSFGDGRFAQAFFPILGTNPPKPERRPPLMPDVPCETQERPDLRTRPGPGHPQVAAGVRTAAGRARQERAKGRALDRLQKELELVGLDRRFRVQGARPEEARR